MATHGYVVGVFTGAESDPAADALTVWVRLAASAPYVQANWTEGIHVADASTDAERAVQADDRWQELGADRILSVRRMAEELYGNAPRCLTYLDTPLRPAVPSLLSQQLTAMEPHEIGEALIALSGMTHLLEQEAARRGKALEHARELEKVQADHAQTMAEGEAVLEGVRARALARAALEEGRRAWQRFVASSCLQSVRADQKLGAELDDKNEQVCQAQDLVGQARSRFDKLRAAADLVSPMRHSPPGVVGRQTDHRGGECGTDLGGYHARPGAPGDGRSEASVLPVAGGERRRRACRPGGGPWRAVRRTAAGGGCTPCRRRGP